MLIKNKFFKNHIFIDDNYLEKHLELLENEIGNLTGVLTILSQLRGEDTTTNSSVVEENVSLKEILSIITLLIDRKILDEDRIIQAKQMKIDNFKILNNTFNTLSDKDFENKKNFILQIMTITWSNMPGNPGQSKEERDSIRDKMEQLFNNCIEPHMDYKMDYKIDEE